MKFDRQECIYSSLLHSSIPQNETLERIAESGKGWSLRQYRHSGIDAETVPYIGFAKCFSDFSLACQKGVAMNCGSRIDIAQGVMRWYAVGQLQKTA